MTYRRRLTAAVRRGDDDAALIATNTYLDTHRYAVDRRRATDLGQLDRHRVYVAYCPRIRLFRVGVAKTRQTLALQLRGGWELVDETSTPTWFHAQLVKHDILDAVGPWRVEVDKDRVPKGHRNGWRSTGPTIDLLPVSRAIRRRLDRLAATTSAQRSRRP